MLSYFALHLFFIVIGAGSDVREVVAAGPWLFFYMILIILIHAVVVYGIGWLARFDLATVTLASQAAVGGPGSALALGMALKWKHRIAPAVIVGSWLRVRQLPGLCHRMAPAGGAARLMGRQLRGHRVLVTGAARGLGASAALGLAEAGAECILLDRSRDELRRRSRQRRTAGPVPSTRWSATSLTGKARSTRRRAPKRSPGDLTALVHCAAVLHLRSVAETTDAQWDEMLAVNLRSAFLLVSGTHARARGGERRFHPAHQARGRESWAFAREGAYCATKFGIEGLAKALAEECGDIGIDANTITPGARRIKPTGLSRAEEAALPEGERIWGFLGGARTRVRGPSALLPGAGDGAPNGRRFEADRVADMVRDRAFRFPARRGRNLAACEQSGAAQFSRWGLDRRCIPPEPLHFVPLIVAFRSKYTRYSSLTRRPTGRTGSAGPPPGELAPPGELGLTDLGAHATFPQATSE